MLAPHNLKELISKNIQCLPSSLTVAYIPVFKLPWLHKENWHICKEIFTDTLGLTVMVLELRAFFSSVFKKDVCNSTTILLHIVITQPNYMIICLYTNYTIKNHYRNVVDVFESIKTFLNPLRQLTNEKPSTGSRQTCQIHGMIPHWALWETLQCCFTFGWTGMWNITGKC